jgi:RNA polymerase sigma-70 factor (ECF subfamily)
MVGPELLDACRRGDPGAFEEVVRRTYRQVYTQALRLVGDRQDAEDVAQDAYVRAFRGLGSFRGDAQFETWLYRIVANAAMSHLRRRRRFGELLVEEADEDRTLELPSPARVAEEAVDRDVLARAMETLPLSLRSVVVLKDVYGFSCEEIGELVGTTEGAVKVRLHRARRRLKALLFGAEGDDS